MHPLVQAYINFRRLSIVSVLDELGKDLEPKAVLLQDVPYERCDLHFLERIVLCPGPIPIPRGNAAGTFPARKTPALFSAIPSLLPLIVLLLLSEGRLGP